MKISTKSRYGLRAMIYLAKAKKDICSLREISKKEGISFDYLEKIISKLEKVKLVAAKKGVRGGYFLTKRPEKIKVGKIVEVLENGDISLVGCIGRRKKYLCPKEKNCLSRKFWKILQESLNSTLYSTTLADLIKEK